MGSQTKTNMPRITISISINASDFMEVLNGGGCMSLTSLDGSHDLFVHGTPQEIADFAGRIAQGAKMETEVSNAA
jgi:hypothetical protein